MSWRGNRFGRNRRFSPQPSRNRQFDGVTLAPGEQVRLLPALPLRFLGNDPIRFGLRAGPVQRSRLTRPKLTLHLAKTAD